jgi:hypothetical protein
MDGFEDCMRKDTQPQPFRGDAKRFSAVDHHGTFSRPVLASRLIISIELEYNTILLYLKGREKGISERLSWGIQF